MKVFCLMFYHILFFRTVDCTTGFIENTPELFDITPHDDKEIKILTYLGEKAVNETKGVTMEHDVPRVASCSRITGPPRYKTDS